MNDELETNEELLTRIRNPEDLEAWAEFMAIYEPLLHRLSRKYGLQAADGENLVQEVMQKVAKQLCQRESQKPSSGFRRWLATVGRNAAIDSLRRVRPDAAAGGTSVHERLQNICDQEDPSNKEFQRQLERQAFRWSAARIRGEFSDDTWKAFWETMVVGRSCDEVASAFGKSVGSIYTARSRVMQRLKTEVKTFDWNVAEYADEAGPGL